MATVNVPQYSEMLWPALQAVAELGGSASISEIVETVIKREGFSDTQQAVLHNNGPETEIGYRLAWARTYLKGMGLLTNSARGVWALTDEGTALVTDPSAPTSSTVSGSARYGRATWSKRERRGRPDSRRMTASPVCRSQPPSAAGKSSCSIS